jgi:hypothetical protein
MFAGNTPSVEALLRETRTIPIVFTNLSDPVGTGVVGSLARPGGNVTGFTAYEYIRAWGQYHSRIGLDPFGPPYKIKSDAVRLWLTPVNTTVSSAVVFASTSA